MPEPAPGIGGPGYARRGIPEAAGLLRRDPAGSVEIDSKQMRPGST